MDFEPSYILIAKKKQISVLLLFSTFLSCGKTIDIKIKRFQEVELSNISANDDCQNFLAEIKDYDDNQNFFKKIIQVPLDWSDHSLKETVNIFVYGLRGSSNLGPTIFINGGPLGASHSSFIAMAEKAASLNFDFVFFDQRGTGCSSQIPELTNLDSLRILKNFRTVELVHDIEAIKQVLWGEESKIKIMGQSFGGFVGFRYFSTFPESVLSLHIHGYALMKDNLKWYINRFYSQKKVSDYFFELFPQARIDFELLNEIISQDLCINSFGKIECGPKILQFMTGVLGQFNQWEKLAARIAQLLTDDRNLNIEELEKWLGRYGSEKQNEAMAKIVVTYTEVNVRQNYNYDFVGCRSFFDYLNKNAESYDDWLLSECRLTDIESAPQSVLGIIEGIGYRPYGYSEFVATLKEFETKLFLYSSEFDPYVPPISFDDIVSELNPRKHKYMEIKESGHDAFVTEEAIWQDLLHDK